MRPAGSSTAAFLSAVHMYIPLLTLFAGLVPWAADDSGKKEE
jgi:hypothetical protein